MSILLRNICPIWLPAGGGIYQCCFNKYERITVIDNKIFTLRTGDFVCDVDRAAGFRRVSGGLVEYDSRSWMLENDLWTVVNE